MKVRCYKAKDYETICGWFNKRNLNSPTTKQLPKNGAIVDDLACGFLFITDGDFAYIDFYIANPDSDKDQRSKALQLVTEQLIEWAKYMEYSHIMANTQFNSIETLAINNGFKNIGKYSVLMKGL
jgi:hypothetical protein